MSNIKNINEKIERLNKKILSKTKKKENIIIATCAEFFSSVFVTSVFGYFLDYIFATKYIFLIIFMIAGFCVGFINVYRLLSREVLKENE